MSARARVQGIFLFVYVNQEIHALFQQITTPVVSIQNHCFKLWIRSVGSAQKMARIPLPTITCFAPLVNFNAEQEHAPSIFVPQEHQEWKQSARTRPPSETTIPDTTLTADRVVAKTPALRIKNNGIEFHDYENKKSPRIIMSIQYLFNFILHVHLF